MKKRVLKTGLIVVAAIITVTIIFAFITDLNLFDYVMSRGECSGKSRENDIVCSYAQENDIELWRYPDYIIELLDKNSETLQFVLEYPENKRQYLIINLS